MEKEKVITFIGMILIIIPYTTSYFSAEWEFLFFITAALLYGIFNIDSRIFILVAILTLSFIPFLLITDANTLAETLAIYVYYLLVVGVVLQIVEYMRKVKNTVTLEKLLKRSFADSLHFFFLAAIIGFGVTYIFNNSFRQEFILSVGLYATSLVLYAVLYFLQQNTVQQKQRLKREAE